MTNGELLTIYATGFSLTAVILFLVFLIGRINDTRPLAKIRVRSNDRDRRALAPGDEHEAVQPQILVGGLILTFLVVSAILARLGNP